jgi:hypothetical protein
VFSEYEIVVEHFGKRYGVTACFLIISWKECATNPKGLYPIFVLQFSQAGYLSDAFPPLDFGNM